MLKNRLESLEKEQAGNICLTGYSDLSLTQ